MVSSFPYACAAGTRLGYWCQLVLPAAYDDSLSYYELLCKVVKYINDRKDDYNELVDVVAKNADDIKQLQDDFQKFIDSGFDEYYADQVIKWIDAHMEFVFQNTVRQVFFGLTSDGYFAAYIPRSWDDIIFDTGMDFSDDSYGRLILRWNVDSVHPVNQTMETREERPHGTASRNGD